LAEDEFRTFRSFPECRELNQMIDGHPAITGQKAGMMNRVRRIALMAVALCVALATMAGGAVAKPHPMAGRLDPSFGQGGTFTVPTPQIVAETGQTLILPTRLAVAPSNKSYVQQGQLVVGFGANGRPDPKFGNHGQVWVQPGPGKVVGVAGVTVDSKGRILVAGTYEPSPGIPNPIAKGEAEPLLFGGKPATEAFVVRYLPNGQPDPTFGTAGVVITSLNVPRPTNEPFGEKAPTAEFERPVVTVSGIRVDPQNRPVLAGEYVYGMRTCFFKQQFKHAIVARLTSSGSVDTSFGSDGFTAIPGEHTLALAGGPGGEWVALGEEESACYRDLPPLRSTTAVLSETGAPSTALDPARPTPNTEGALAIDQQGRILVAEEEGKRGTETGRRRSSDSSPMEISTPALVTKAASS
jgi:uncharacterized delta-60 repeat protein